ncbi:MAG: dodecin domain-containing protein [Gammaproteobacteria bacterium]|nr:MAG: dodecin domain-containing protein [Gammaproteobacteria bacterium]
MSVAKTIEIIASSKKGFDDAMRNGLKTAGKTLKNVSGAWIQDQDVVVSSGRITEYRVRMRVTFVLE